MWLPPIPPCCGGGIDLAILAHHALSIHGEWDVKTPEILVFHAVLFASILTTSSATGCSSFFDGLLYTSYCYMSALFTSIIGHRFWFHRGLASPDLGTCVFPSCAMPRKRGALRTM
ncbi:hypothetical protein F4779DRAFT_597002 [Xylariaceae sp. FL0662B]|nr:hypothetical protein F4779DRAFT_597002 [Xylariaceae sp. FL0662B]